MVIVMVRFSIRLMVRAEISARIMLNHWPNYCPRNYLIDILQVDIVVSAQVSYPVYCYP